MSISNEEPVAAGPGQPGAAGEPGKPGTPDGRGGAGGSGGPGGQGGTAGDEGTGGVGGTGGIGGMGGPGAQGDRATFRKLLYAIVALFVLSFVIGAANLLFTNNQVENVQANSNAIAQANQRLNTQLIAIVATNTKLQQQIIADCSFYRDLAGLPLAAGPNGKPSELGVRVISDSRATWHGHGCPGKLPVPDPTFVAGAKLYHLPVN